MAGLFYSLVSLMSGGGMVVLRGAQADIAQDRQALLDFIKEADKSGAIAQKWKGDDPCEPVWEGVKCSNGRVSDLVLEAKQLGGRIKDDTITRLDQLERLSLKNNTFSGPIPTFAQSPGLRGIWLSNNSFSGSIPDIFGSTPRFHKLDLSHNALSGDIPPSLVSLPKLNTLLLQNNALQGGLPPFNQTTLLHFDLSRNKLSGAVPNTYFFTHLISNTTLMSNNLCGRPLSTACPPKKGLSKTVLVLIIVVADIVFLALAGFVAVQFYKRRNRQRKGITHDGLFKEKNSRQDLYSGVSKAGNPAEDAMGSIEDPTAKTYDKATRQEDISEAEKSKLVVFSRPGRVTFDLEELLRASAEMLGKGTVGTAYKAVLLNAASAVVVKRLRDITQNGVGKKEFEMQMLLLGQLQHPNLVPLLAYYFAKDEKFLVHDYVPFGSLFSLLHGNHALGKMPLEWKSRLKIAGGIARGMAYLHTHLKGQTVPHGNLKSTNVLIDEDMVPKIVDFGMVPLLTPSRAQSMAAYKAPEYSINKDINHQADVYSYGVILLELLTGKVPSHLGNSTMDLSQWVASLVSDDEQQITDIIDKELRMSNDMNVEMEMALIQDVARRCTAMLPEKRPTMLEVLKLIDEIRKVDSPTTNIAFSSPGSFVTEYETPKHSFDSRGSNFQGLVSPNVEEGRNSFNR